MHLAVSLSRVSPSLLHLLAPTLSQASVCHSRGITLDGSLSHAADLNSYSNSALFLAQHSPISPPRVNIAAHTRHESRSQVCGSKEVHARTQQSAMAPMMALHLVLMMALHLAQMMAPHSVYQLAQWRMLHMVYCFPCVLLSSNLRSQTSSC